MFKAKTPFPHELTLFGEISIRHYRLSQSMGSTSFKCYYFNLLDYNHTSSCKYY